MEVAQHCAGILSAKDSYDIAVDATKEHCHGPAGAEGTSGHFLWVEANHSADASDSGADCLGDVLAFEDAPLCAVMVACNRMCGGASAL